MEYGEQGIGINNICGGGIVSEESKEKFCERRRGEERIKMIGGGEIGNGEDVGNGVVLVC